MTECRPGDPDGPHRWWISGLNRPECADCGWVPQAESDTRRRVRATLGSRPPDTPDTAVRVDLVSHRHGIRRIGKRDGWRCWYCHLPFPTEERYVSSTAARGRHRSGPATLTIDHRIPLSRGGRDIISNKVLACGHCNGEKGALTDTEYAQWRNGERLAPILEWVRSGSHRNRTGDDPFTDIEYAAIGVTTRRRPCDPGDPDSAHDYHLQRNGNARCRHCHHAPEPSYGSPAVLVACGLFYP